MPTDPTASAERLYRAPRNAVAAPLGRDLSTPAGSRDIPVLIRLVWERRVQIVPARVLRWGYGTAYVEWWPNPESSSASHVAAPLRRAHRPVLARHQRGPTRVRSMGHGQGHAAGLTCTAECA